MPIRPDHVSVVQLEKGVVVSYITRNGHEIELEAPDITTGTAELEMALEHYKANRYSK